MRGRRGRRLATQSFEVSCRKRDDAHTLVSLHEMVRDQDPEVSKKHIVEEGDTIYTV